MNEKKFEIKAYSKKELANMYQVHTSTFVKWLNKIEELNTSKFQKILTPLQVEKIVEHIGQP